MLILLPDVRIGFCMAHVHPSSHPLAIGRARWLTHLVLLLLSGFAYWLGTRYVPRGAFSYVATLAFGYWSLLLVAVTLVIGPLRLFMHGRLRRNPVNDNLRRDVGIWAGITALLHVLFGLQQRFGGDIIRFFFYHDANGWHLLTNTFGIANHVGLLATLLIIALLVTSNTLSLRNLKGPRWKALQRFNYGLFAFAVLHTVLYQSISGREGMFADAVIWGTLATVVVHFVGLSLVRARRREV
jgi:sulfoxide reductase heme-binding subunit YedZ